MRILLLLLMFVTGLMARPMDKKLELLIEEEVLLDRIQQELSDTIENEERKIKRELRGEESMRNFFSDYSRRFPHQAGLWQYRPGR